MSKIDLDAAYCRIHTEPSSAVTSVSILEGIAYIETRLPFGAAAGPSIFSTVSEAIFDLVNDLLSDETWNPTTLHAPEKTTFSPPMTNSDSSPFVEAEELALPVPLQPLFCDGYIDNGILVGVEEGNNAEKLSNAGPLATYTVFRPVDNESNNEQNRDAPLAPEKLAAELQPSEIKTILRWVINTRLFRIYLPKQKYVEWIQDIQVMLEQGIVCKDELHTTIG